MKLETLLEASGCVCLEVNLGLLRKPISYISLPEWTDSQLKYMKTSVTSQDEIRDEFKGD
jgi:hypothetical protein